MVCEDFEPHYPFRLHYVCYMQRMIWGCSTVRGYCQSRGSSVQLIEDDGQVPHWYISIVFYVNCWINCWIYGIYRISIMLVAGNFCCKETAHFAKVWASQVKLQTQKEILQTPAFLESGRIRMASQNWWAETWPGLVVIPIELSTLGLAFASLRSS